MKVVWSPQAKDDINSLFSHIAEDNPAAEQMVVRIVDNAETLLSANPSLGRPGRVPGTRELVVSRTPYIVPYRVRADRIEILRVYHNARHWPEQF